MKKNLLNNFITRNSTEINLGLISILIGLSLLFVFISFSASGEINFPVDGNDSSEYFNLAKNIKDHLVFSLDFQEPYSPEVFRTPGYPFFLAILFSIVDTPLFASLVQLFFWAAVIVIVFRLTSIWFGKRVGLLVAILMMFEPGGWYSSLLIMSDTLFIFFLLLGIYIFLKNKLHWKNIIGAALAFALAIYIRPIALFLPLFIVIWYICYSYKNLRLDWPKLLLFLGIIIIVLIPWLARNEVKAGSFSISSVSGYNLGYYNSAMYYAYENNINLTQARGEYLHGLSIKEDKNLRTFIVANELQAKSLLYLKSNLPGYTKYHLIKTIPFFITDSFRDLLRIVNYKGVKSYVSDRANISGMLLSGNLGEFSKLINDAFTNNDADVFYWLAGVVFWIIVCLLGLLSFIVYLIKGTKKQKWLVILSAGIILYFALLSSPVANARYRLPAQPFMFVLASSGIFYLFNLLKFRNESKQ